MVEVDEAGRRVTVRFAEPGSEMEVDFDSEDLTQQYTHIPRPCWCADAAGVAPRRVDETPSLLQRLSPKTAVVSLMGHRPCGLNDSCPPLFRHVLHGASNGEWCLRCTMQIDVKSGAVVPVCNGCSACSECKVVMCVSASGSRGCGFTCESEACGNQFCAGCSEGVRLLTGRAWCSTCIRGLGVWI